MKGRTEEFKWGGKGKGWRAGREEKRERKDLGKKRQENKESVAG